MSRLIDADLLKRIICEDQCERPDGCDSRCEMIAYIDDTLTIEAEPVRHGHWEMKEDPYMFFSEIPICSVCRCIPKMRIKTAYCSSCGAKMDEVSK